MQRGILRPCALFAIAAFCLHTSAFLAIAQQQQQTREGIYPNDFAWLWYGFLRNIPGTEPQSVGGDLRQKSKRWRGEEDQQYENI